MPNIFTDTTLSEVYNDDYRDSDNYHQILFNNGRALQQRELNQLQTILSKEIERFGRNIFKEGAAVQPVQNVKVNNDYKYVQVEQTSVPGGVDLVGLTMTGATSGVEAKVLEVAPYVDANNPLTLYVAYTNTDAAAQQASDTESVTFSLTENIQNLVEGVTLTVKGTATALGSGIRADIGQGIYFVRGHMVQANPQNILLSRYTNDISTELGFKIIEDVVTVDDTTALYDNTGDVPKLSSPGADRYRIRLQLSNATDIQNDEQFAYIAKIVDGEVVEVNNGRREYNLILDLLAQRTFEESGNYAVKPFLSLFEEHPTDNSKLNLKVQPGSGYVLGYRVEPGGKTIAVNKPQTTVTFTDEDISADYGNFVLVEEPVGLFNVSTFELVTMYDDSAATGNAIGTARVRSLEQRTDGKYRLFLFDVGFNGASNISQVKSFGSGSKYANVNPDAVTPRLLEADKNTLFFNLPAERPDWTVDPSFDLVVQKVFSGQSDGSGDLLLSTGNTSTFTSTNEWLVFEENGPLENVTLGQFSATGNTSITISGLTPSTNYDVFTLINTQNVAPRKKSRTTYSFSSALDSDGSLSLQRADIISVTVIDDTTSNDVTANYILDNGQRDNFYDIGSITLRPNRDAPATTVTVTVTYFSHSSSGGYFSAASYNNNISGFTYADIPSYTTSRGRVVQLRDVLDFRSTKQYNGAGFTQTASGARLNPLPRNTATISSDLRYYLPRNDVLVITTEEELLYIEGIPSTNPKFPPVPPKSMLLYTIELAANTINVSSDIRLNYIDNRRYTMRDIGRLDRQIQENRELITLNALELDTKTLEVLDENGLPRTKAGFFVDNFTNFKRADVSGSNLLCSMDIEQGILKPHFFQKELPYVYDSAASTNVVQKGNGIFLKYNHEVLIDQPKASGVINVNPFNVITNNGVMTLIPNRDNWMSTRVTAREIEPAQFIPGRWAGANSNILRGLENIDRNWRMWDWSWWGREGLLNNVRTANGTAGGISARNGRGAEDFARFLTAQNVPNASQNANDFVSRHGALAIQFGSETSEARVTRQTDIPFMRSREIAVKVEGLMPLTRHYPFFDEVNVLKWCKQLNESQYNALVAATRSDEPPVYDTAGLTEREDGFTATGITSDDKGTAYFSFIVPETDDLIFPTGTLELAVYDITSPVASLANSQAAAEYTARGIEEELEESSRTVRLTTYDPIAQSFRNALNHGVYLTKVDIFVATKDADRPLIVEIRPLVNGAPSALERLRYGIATKRPDQIVTSADATVATTFEFDRPVFLEANTSYAVVVRSESNQYFVWQATMGEFELNSTEKRITAQPYMGSLFASQNGETWEPQQDKDLKFTAYVADFTPSGLSGTAFMQNAKVPAARLPNDPFQTTSGSTNMRVEHPYHGMNEGDYVVLSGGTEAPTGFSPANIITDSDGIIISDVDLMGYNIALDSAASTSEIAGGSNWFAIGNHRYHMGRNAVNTFRPNNTSISAYNRFTSQNSIMAGGNNYSKDVTRILTAIQEDLIFETPRVVGSQRNENLSLAGVKSLDFEADFFTSNRYLSPVINIDNSSFMALQHLIDWQTDSAGVPNTIVPFGFVPETAAAGGTSLSKYETKEIAFVNPSTGLKILVGANVPTTADFDVYYKTASESELISTKPWVLVESEVDNPKDNDPNVFREYRYLAGGLTGTLDEFTVCKIKIVMKSITEAKYPSFRDLRVIAMED